MFLQFSVYIMQLLGCLCDEPGPSKQHFSQLDGAGGPWSGWWLVMTHREQGQGNDQGGPDTQGPGREGQCHCMVSEIGGNLLGYQWHDSLICPVQTYFVPNLIQFDHFWSKNILISFTRLEIKGKFQLCVLDIWNY